MASDSKHKESGSQTLNYPPARRDETCVETLFGHSVPDPYRWLENPDSEETRAFVDRQNAFSRPFYATPLRQQFFETLKKAFNFPKQGVPWREGDRWVSWYNSGLQNQSVLHVRTSLHLDEEPRVLVDPNTWTEDGTAAVNDTEFTEDGSLLAYTRADQGSDWSKIYFLNVEDGSLLPDVLERVKFCKLTWAPDNSGIFYNAYDLKESQTTEGTEIEKHEFLKVYYHKLGTQQENDILIVHHPGEPDWLSHISISWDQRYLILQTYKGCSPENQLWIADLNEVTERQKDEAQTCDFSRLKWRKVVTGFEASYDYVTNDGILFYFLSDKGAPRKHILTYDLAAADGQQAWQVHVPEGEHFLDAAKAVDGNKLVLQYIVDVTGRLHIRDLPTGTFLGEIALPHGTLDEVSCKRTFSHLLFDFTSFNIPGIIYSVSLQTPAPKKIWEPEIFHETRVEGLDLRKIAVEQHFYPGKDGQRIPLFLVHNKELALTPNTPLLLTGYGGFNIPNQPHFRVSVAVAALHFGMAYAVANIRGGGEYGKTWYEAAIKSKKQVSLDDFQEAARFLIQQGYTSAERLAIQGASNGGFLVAACANQRPDLFKAVVSLVGVLDLTRFHKFTIGTAWKSDYGDPDKEADFPIIMKLSPLHNIPRSPRGQYPAAFLITADHDDRVAPLHSLKFIAELQHIFRDNPRQSNPLLIRVETKAGHGAGKPTLLRLEEVADIYGFLGTVLGLKWHA